LISDVIRYVIQEDVLPILSDLAVRLEYQLIMCQTQHPCRTLSTSHSIMGMAPNVRRPLSKNIKILLYLNYL
jgi:hypothetical protein